MTVCISSFRESVTFYVDCLY